MVAWTGFGWLAYAIIIGAFMGTVYLFDLMLGAGFARKNPILVCACSWVIGCLLCWPVGRYFNRDVPVRVFDADWAWRGRTNAHSTFFVRLEFAAGLLGLPFHILVAVYGFEWLEGR